MTRTQDFRLVDAIVAFVLVTSAVMLLQLVLGAFEPIYSFFLSVLLCGALALAFVRGLHMPTRPAAWAPVVVLAVLALAPRWDPFLYVEGGQDQGIYVAMSSHFARTHGIPVIDSVRERLSDSAKADYDRLNNRYYAERVEVPGRFEGEHQPGIYIADLDRSRYVFQFYPLHPAWMAMAATLLGAEQRVYALVTLSVLAIVMLSLLAYEIAGRRPAAGFIVAALLALNPMHAFLSRFPVSENVTVFFSATAFYYLVRYFKSGGSTIPLVFSAGAWACVFFTHIAGFLYAPILAAVVLAGAAGARDRRAMLHMLGYGLAVLGAFALSLWYGTTWAFPYSYQTYRQVFGQSLGALVLDEWPALIVATGIAGTLLVFAAWHLRDRIRGIAKAAHLHRGLIALLFLITLAAFFDSLLGGYQLGFTPDYVSQAEQRDLRWAPYAEQGRLTWNNLVAQWANQGLAGFFHSSAAALVLYVSPFILLAGLVLLAVRRGRLDPFETVLAFAIGLFVAVRIGLTGGLTLYYYSGRYIAGELVPCLLVFGGLGIYALSQAGGLRRVAAVVLLAGALLWEVIALVPQFPGGEMNRLDASMRPLVDKLGEEDLLLLSGVRQPALQTSLDHYYGRRAIEVVTRNLPQVVRQYARIGSDIYVLSDRAIADLPYVGTVTLVRSGYAKLAFFDVLPMNASSVVTRYYLYRADRPDLARLREGDIINFGREGQVDEYLGAGWSGQEEVMRWTEGPSATLRLPFVRSMQATVLNFEVRSHNCVEARVLVNGEPRAPWKFTDCNKYLTRSVPIKPEDVRLGTVIVSFEMPGVKSPQDLDAENPDKRKLGISVRRIVVGTELPSQPVSAELREGDAVRFDRRGNAEQYLGSGWSGQEEDMRWTDGKLALLQLPFAEGITAATLTFEALSFNCIDVGVSVNDQLRKRWTFTDCGAYATQTIALGREDLRQGTVTIAFSMPNAKSPQELNPATPDRRKLGISVRKLTVDPPSVPN